MENLSEFLSSNCADTFKITDSCIIFQNSKIIGTSFLNKIQDFLKKDNLDITFFKNKIMILLD